jgi:hypothetical protein
MSAENVGPLLRMGTMSLQPCGSKDKDHGDAAVVVPLEEYRRLRALESLATTADLDAAEADAIMQGYRDWSVAGRPGALSHSDAMAQLLGSAAPRLENANKSEH